MTARQLYEIVKDVPREIWPGEIDFDNLRANSSWWESGRVDGVSDDLAEAAFVGAMVKHLRIKLSGRMEIDYLSHEGSQMLYTVTINIGWDELRFRAPTLIEALAAAVKATKETKP